jgi:hypothetical protein
MIGEEVRFLAVGAWLVVRAYDYPKHNVIAGRSRMKWTHGIVGLQFLIRAVGGSDPFPLLNVVSSVDRHPYIARRKGSESGKLRQLNLV